MQQKEKKVLTTIIVLLCVFLLTGCDDEEIKPESFMVSTLAGTGAEGLSDGPGAGAVFRLPRNLAVNTNNEVFVNDGYGQMLRKVKADGLVSTMTKPDLEFVYFRGQSYSFGDLVFDANDALYVSVYSYQIGDVMPNIVVKLNSNEPQYIYRRSFSWSLTTIGSIASSTQSALYLTYGCSIAKLDESKNEVSFCGAGCGFLDGAANEAQFSGVADFAFDSKGNIIAADAGNHRIRKITPAGVATTLAGKSRGGFADGKGEEALFNSPSAIALDKFDNIYVADTGNNAIRKITPDGEVSTLAGNGMSGFADGQGKNSLFNAPQGIVVDQTGRIVVADTGNHRIRIIEKQ